MNYRTFAMRSKIILSPKIKMFIYIPLIRKDAIVDKMSGDKNRYMILFIQVEVSN